MDNVVRYPFQVREYDVQNENGVIISLLLAITIVCAVIVLFLLFNFELANKIILSLIGLLVYIVLLLVILQPSRVREVRKNVVMSVDKPVIKEVIREVEKPVVKKVIVEKPVVKRIYVEKKHKKLDIPHYNYVGSMQTRTYHLRNCRLGKLVKNKYKLSNNSVEFFRKRKFKPCKVCVLKQKKI
jgi:hypothetical protein